MHHIVALHWLCPSLFAGNRPLSVADAPMTWSMTPMKNYNIFRSARQAKPPCSIRYNPILSLLLSSTALGQSIQLLHAAVVEPLSSAWPVITTVNRWNPLAWVGIVWALMCLLIHASCHACYCLELSLVWFIGNELECGEHVLLLRAKCGTRFGKGSGERPCRSTWWVVSLQPSSGTEFCVCDPWTVTTTHWVPVTRPLSTY